jgi:hypothetical protein
MPELLELSEAGSRVIGFWIWVFSPKCRVRVAEAWRQRSSLGRAGLALELLIFAVLGTTVPVIVWSSVA